MNRVILMGRLTRDPELRYSQGERSMAIARYTLAVDRRGRRSQDGSEQTADFIPCVAFDRAGEFAEKYFRQGMRVLVSGRIQTGSYTNRDGQKVYTTEVIVDDAVSYSAVEAAPTVTSGREQISHSRLKISRSDRRSMVCQKEFWGLNRLPNITRPPFAGLRGRKLPLIELMLSYHIWKRLSSARPGRDI